MVNKLSRSRRREERADQPQPLLDLRTLTVLLLGAGAGWLAYREGGWQAALIVGTTVTAALHTLLRRS